MAEIHITITDCDLYDENEIVGFDFAELAGVSAVIYLDNQCDDTLVIDKLVCDDVDSCKSMSFRSIDNSLNYVVREPLLHITFCCKSLVT